MKTTGIVRRIDDLGRIVIPKEMRNTLRIKNGDSLDVLVDDDKIILQKYSSIAKLEDKVNDYVLAFYSLLHINIIVSDRDKVISVSPNLENEYLYKEISDSLLRIIDSRDKIFSNQKTDVNFILEKMDNCYYSVSSIVSNSDAVGSVIFFSYDGSLSLIENELVSILAKLLARHIEWYMIVYYWQINLN